MGDISRTLSSAKIDRREVKVAVLFIALGFILGGIAGLSQKPPSISASGWSITNNIPTSWAFVVPDQNDDNVNEIFFWINPSEAYDGGQVNPWEDQSGCVLINGETGIQLIEKKYTFEGRNWFVYNEEYMFRTKNNKIIAFAVPEAPYNASLSRDDEYYMEYAYEWSEYSALQISLETLEIVKRVNVFEENWDTYITDIPWALTYDYRLDYYPQIRYIRDTDMVYPNTSYSDDTIAFKNFSPLQSPDGPWEDWDKDRFMFIDPESLEIVCNVTLDNGLSSFNTFERDFEFCKGPNLDTEKNWYYPFIYQIGYDDAMAYPSMGGTDQTISLGPINGMRNYTDGDCWLNLTGNIFSEIMVDYWPNAREFNSEVFVSMNSSGSVNGITIFQKLISQMLNPYYQNDKYSDFFGTVYSEPNRTLIVASRVTSWNFDNYTDVKVSFNYESRLKSFPGFTNNINYNDTENGVCVNVVPISCSNDPLNKTSSIALVFSTQDVKEANIKGFDYLHNERAVYFLTPEAAGASYMYMGWNWPNNKLDLTNGTRLSRNQISAIENYNLNEFTFIPVNFYMDDDNLTDIPIITSLLSPKEIEQADVPVITGPFFSVSQNGSINQIAYLSFRELDNVNFNDANDDGVMDVLVSNFAMVFSVEQTTVPVSYLESIDKDPATKSFFVIGIILLLIGIVIFSYVLLKMKDTSVRIKTVGNKVRLYIMLAIAILMIIGLYSQIATLTSSVSTVGGSQIGDTEQGRAIQSLSRISGYATFVLLLFLPLTVGLYIALAPWFSEKIIALNQIIFTRRAGLEAAIKRKAVLNPEEKANVRFRIAINPPFGKYQKTTYMIKRIFSILTLSMTIGLIIFNYTADIFFQTDSITVFTGITDDNFITYVTALFLLLIIPGIIAIPLFYWLYPSSWLLDDAGVCFYFKSIKDRRPEDVESVGRWFSGYLKGFFGISAIFSYVSFIMDSPILNSAENLGKYSNTVMVFTFGFIIVVGLVFGILTVIMLDLVLPYQANRLFIRMEKRNYNMRIQSISFNEHEKLTVSGTLDGYFGKKMNNYRDTDSIGSEVFGSESNDTIETKDIE